MSTVEEIKAAFESLSLSECAEVARFVHGWHDDAWDEQIKRDFDAGKFNRILKEIDADERIETATELGRTIPEPKGRMA